MFVCRCVQVYFCVCVCLCVCVFVCGVVKNINAIAIQFFRKEYLNFMIAKIWFICRVGKENCTSVLQWKGKSFYCNINQEINVSFALYSNTVWRIGVQPNLICQTNIRTHTNIQTYTNTHTHTQTHTYIHSHTQNTHTYKQTHMHTLPTVS